MIRCYYCGSKITSKTYWKRYDYLANKYVDVCNYCASCHVDEHHSWGLLLQFND